MSIIVYSSVISCVFSIEPVESVSHLFVRCPFLPSDLTSLLGFMFELGGGKRKG